MMIILWMMPCIFRGFFRLQDKWCAGTGSMAKEYKSTFFDFYNKEMCYWKVFYLSDSTLPWFYCSIFLFIGCLKEMFSVTIKISTIHNRIPFAVDIFIFLRLLRKFNPPVRNTVIIRLSPFRPISSQTCAKLAICFYSM